MSSPKKLTDLARHFTEPRNPTQRLYEALRAYFVEGLASAQAAQRFGYAPASFRVLVHRFRQDPDRPFFLTPAKGPHAAPKTDRARARVIALRKQNLSIYDISRALAAEDQPLSPVAVAAILSEEGFARLPRRRDEERPPATRPSGADAADVRRLDLTPRTVRTQFGGLFLFLPTLAQVPPGRHPPPGRLPRLAEGPRGRRRPLPVGPQTLRRSAAQPCHERRARRGPRPLRRAQRHP